MLRTRFGAAVAVAVATAILALTSVTACGEPSRLGAPALPSPTAKPTTATPTTPKPSPSTTPPVKPTTVTPARLPPAKGTGPGGSLKITGSSKVALTFDDGPDPVNTPKMLDILKRNGVKATFCLVGRQARAYPSLVRRIVAEGHTVCNHSWAHSMVLRKQTTEVILKDLTATNNAIHRAAPDAKIKYFRAPGGYFSTRLVGLAASLGMKSIYWSVDTRDWEFSVYGRGTPMINHIVSAIQTQTRRGSIILAHDYNKPDTVAAISKVLPWLKKHVTLTALPT